MKLTPRERWLCATLPAVLTALIYFGGLARPVRSERGRLRADLQRQDSENVLAGKLRLAQSEQERLRQELKALRNRTAPLSSTSASPAPGEPNRFATLRAISRLCEQVGLSLVSSTPLNDMTALREPWMGSRALPELTGRTDAALWRLSGSGSYGEMLRLLDAIATAEAPVVTLGIGMEPPGDEAKPIAWVLTLWL